MIISIYIYICQIVIAFTLFNSHFSTRLTTLPPSTCICDGLSKIIPCDIGKVPDCIITFVPGDVFKLT